MLTLFKPNLNKQISRLNNRIESNPLNSFETYNLKGLLLIDACESNEKAYECFNRSIQLNPNYINAYLNKGI
jgi:lipoprotein NlpI